MMGRDLGKVVSDIYRVGLGDKTGAVRRFMSDGRSIVDWDDGTSNVMWSGHLAMWEVKIPHCG